MSKWKRAAVVAAGVAAAGLSATPALAAAPTPTLKPTVMTISVAQSFVGPNQSDTMTATLRSVGYKPVAGATVYLVERKFGAAKFSTPVRLAAKTNAKGQVTVTVVPGSTRGQMKEYGIVFPGDATHWGSRSGTIMIAVV